MSTAPSNFSEFHEDKLSKSLADRESAIKERLQAAWQLHIARVQEELEAGWQTHIGVAVEGALVNLEDSLRTEMLQSAQKIAEAQAETLRNSMVDEAELRLQEAIGTERDAAEQARAEAEKAVEQAEEARIEAEQARSELEEARSELEQTRAEAEQARADAEQARTELEEARRAAEQAQMEAEEARTEVAQVRGEVEQAQSAAEQARAEVEQALTMAEEARSEAEISLRSELSESRAQELAGIEELQRQQLQTLHKAVRRCEQAENREDVVAALLDGVAPYAERAVLLQLEGDMITGFHGTEQREQGVEPISLEIPVEQAPALHNAKQSAEPLVAMRLESEFSRELLEQMGEARDEKMRVFPVMSRNGVRALLLLEAGGKPFQASAVEILTITAGHMWTVGKETAEPAQLITIQGSGQQEPKVKESGQSWFQLSPQEQEIHLRAQRYARVQVAELRLYQSERVRQARKDNNIYGVFRQEIDTVRAEFKTQFVETCPSMLDYYHMEVVRILANENEKVLGPDYPGPLV